jgi:hypothetical protein
MVPELGLGTVGLMRKIKQTLDPDDLFKQVPVPSPWLCVSPDFVPLTALARCYPMKKINYLYNSLRLFKKIAREEVLWELSTTD